ncbi:MAG: hypothetical protein JXR61_02320 [Prolixibacteraceae bacterium]|nr:hypothetical protein [Prolixibacteraceae bacterium]
MKKHFGKKIGIHIAVILVGFLFFSCATQSLIIEIPKKSPNELPDSLQSVLLISRVVDNSYSNLTTDSLQNLFYMQNFDLDTLIKDSLVVDTTIKALGEILFESGRYDYVIPENRFLPPNTDVLLVRELPWVDVKNLCAMYNTDALISLDYLKTYVSTSLERESGFNPFEGGFYSAAVARMNVNYEALIRIYDPKQEKVLIRKLIQDTLFWIDYDQSVGSLFSRFTPVKNALFEAGIAIALDFSDEITPNWDYSRRLFFGKGNSNLKKAAPLIMNNQLEAAMALWMETAENSKSKNKRSKAEFNIALGYELQGDLNKAAEWALKSYNTMYRPNTYEYLEVLKRRMDAQNNQ